MTKLRVASHRLEIEVGRWARPNRVPIADRKCRTCNSIEDEFHFLLECNLYNDLRVQYIKRYYWNRTNVLKGSGKISLVRLSKKFSKSQVLAI